MLVNTRQKLSLNNTANILHEFYMKFAILQFKNCAVPEGVLGTSGVPAGDAAGEEAVQIQVVQVRIRLD